MNTIQTLRSAANAMSGELTALRRDFHRYPEMGWLEMRTSAIIAKHLTHRMEQINKIAIC